MTDHACVFGFEESHPGVVALAVAEDHEAPYREAEEGEAVIPAVLTDRWCIEHDGGPGCWAHDLSWSKKEIDR